MSFTFSEPNQWGFFDVTIKGFGTIKGCKYVASHSFIALPNRKVIGKDGLPKKNQNGKDMYISDLALEKEFEGKMLESYKATLNKVDEDDIPF